MKKFREKVLGINQIRLRPNREVENAFRAYETSWETERLESEGNRKIYCELIGLSSKKNVEKVNENVDNKSSIKAVDKPTVNENADDDDEEEEEEQQNVLVDDEKPKWWTQLVVESKFPRKLNEIALEQIAKNFKIGSIDERISCQDAEDFGLLVDVELPIFDLLKLENEAFWKRVVQSKIRDVLKFQELSRAPETSWKPIGLELKLQEFIENLEQNKFDLPKTIEIFNQLGEKLQSTIENISIKQMKPRRSLEKNPMNYNTRVVNFSSAECQHGSLEFLGLFDRLKTLSIIFNPGELRYTYEKRFFQVATVDIEKIGKALEKLRMLKSFAICRSDLSESMKIHFLLEPMKQMNDLSYLDCSYCAISSAHSGTGFSKLLKASRTLKHLQLKGNNFDYGFCKEFSFGLKALKGKLDFLGLSMNPIFNNGLGLILRSINEENNVYRMDISSCDLDDNFKTHSCIDELISLIHSSNSILEINMNENEMTFGTESFIEAAKNNFELRALSCENCGFSTAELVKIKVLLLRNEFYKENPILRKETFTAEDEIAIEKFLNRTKHPLLLKHKKITTRVELRKPFTYWRSKFKETTRNFCHLAYSFQE